MTDNKLIICVIKTHRDDKCKTQLLGLPKNFPCALERFRVLSQTTVSWIIKGFTNLTLYFLL